MHQLLLPRSVVLALAVVAASALPAQAQGSATTTSPRAFLTREDIAAAVEANWSRIEDLTASFSWRTVGEAPPNVVSTDNMKIVVKGGKTYFYEVYASAEQRASGKVFQREVAFNGKITTVHEPQRAKAMILPSQENETLAGLFPLTSTMMYSGLERQSPLGVDLANLTSCLKSQLASVREYQEEVDGHWCHVADLSSPGNGGKIATLWIDPQRGYLPVRNEIYGGSEDPYVLSRSIIEEAIEVAPNLWVPTRSTCKTGGKSTGKWMCQYKLEVNLLDNGKPDVAINSGVRDEFFDLWRRLPPGTEVYDKLADRGYTMGGEEYRDIAKALESVPEFASLPVPERAGGQTDEVTAHERQENPGMRATPLDARGGMSPWILPSLIGLAVLVGVGTVLVVRRLHATNGGE